MATDFKKIAQNFLHLSWNQGEPERLNALAAENFFYQTTFTENVLSLSQYIEFISTFKSAMPDLMVHIEEVMTEGNRVMTHVTFHGSVAKSFYGIPATDSIIAFPAISLWDIKNGKVASLNTLIDIKGLENQLKIQLNKQPLPTQSGLIAP